MCKGNWRQEDQRNDGEEVKIMQKVPFWFSFANQISEDLKIDNVDDGLRKWVNHSLLMRL